MGQVRNILHDGRIFLGYLFIWIALFSTLVWYSGQQYNILPSYSMVNMTILVIVGLLLSWQKKNRYKTSKWSRLLPIIIFIGIGALISFDMNLKDDTNINIFLGVAAFISLLPTIVQFWRLIKIFRTKKKWG